MIISIIIYRLKSVLKTILQAIFNGENFELSLSDVTIRFRNFVAIPYESVMMCYLELYGLFGNVNFAFENFQF